MTTANHWDLAGTDIHVPNAFTYADPAARNAATGFVAGDVGKLALQTDNHTLWMLTATTPVWQQVDHTGALLAASNLSDVASASTARTNLGLGSAATKDIPASGNASTTQVVYSSDRRVSASRTPAADKASHERGGSDALIGNLDANGRVAARKNSSGGTAKMSMAR